MIFDEPRDGPEPAGGGVLCPMCLSAVLTARHCKLVCEGCGYVESCEDNFAPTESHPAESS